MDASLETHLSPSTDGSPPRRLWATTTSRQSSLTVRLGPALTRRGFFRELASRAQQTLVGRTAVRQFPGHRLAPACVAQQNRATQESNKVVPAYRMGRPAPITAEMRRSAMSHGSAVRWLRKHPNGGACVVQVTLSKAAPRQAGAVAAERPGLIDPRLVEGPRVNSPPASALRPNPSTPLSPAGQGKRPGDP